MLGIAAMALAGVLTGQPAEGQDASESASVSVRVQISDIGAVRQMAQAGVSAPFMPGRSSAILNVRPGRLDVYQGAGAPVQLTRCAATCDGGEAMVPDGRWRVAQTMERRSYRLEDDENDGETLLLFMP